MRKRRKREKIVEIDKGEKNIWTNEREEIKKYRERCERKILWKKVIVKIEKRERENFFL